MQVLLLGLAIGSAVAALPSALDPAVPPASRVAAVALALGLSVHWALGMRRGGFPLACEPLEALALYALLRILPGEPFLPLFGLVYRSLYGSLRLAAVRYLAWMAALVLAHASRGPAYVHADLAKAVGLVLAPGIIHAFRGALEALQVSERRLRSLVQNSTDVTTVVGEDLLVRWQAESIGPVLGRDPERMLGTPVLDLVHPEDRSRLIAYFAAAVGAPGYCRRLSLRLCHGGGDWRQFEVVAANRLHDASVGGFVLNMRDATDQHRLERELRALAARREHDATHDPLTGLPNRRRLFARLNEAIAEARAGREECALVLIDLDHFKELNDTLGHQAGDLLLREIRPRLLAATAEEDLVARLGGDEFAVVLGPGTGAADAEAIARRLQEAIEQPFHVEGLTLLVQASLGIAAYPQHAEDVETLMQRADIAMYSAKQRGGGCAIYSPDRDEHSKDRLALMGELPGAIADGDIVVHYQPKVDLASGHVLGAEALVRWQHPRRGLLAPGAFLPLVEQTGVMRPLALYVLDRALEQCAAWRDAGLTLGVAVNLSAPNLLDLALPDDVARLLARWGVDPALLKLEITETIVAADPVRVTEVMSRLRALGCTMSLDDFGTGSSSLGYLRRLPVQELKIDKSFVFGMHDDEPSRAIVRTIVELGHSLGLRTVAEGIESAEVFEELARLGCDEGQGFFMGRPMPANELTALARARTSAAWRAAA